MDTDADRREGSLTTRCPLLFFPPTKTTTAAGDSRVSPAIYRVRGRQS